MEIWHKGDGTDIFNAV